MIRARKAMRGATACFLTAVVAASAWTYAMPPAQAQEPTLGGYRGRAISSGLYATYNPQGLLPVTSPVDLGAPDALATITSGPSTFARASAADPGDLVANPDAILTLGFPGYPQGTVPEYPYRATATSGFGEPVEESAPAPGLVARAEAQPDGSTARATMPRADAPAVATFGSMSATSTTHTDGSTVSVQTRSEVSGFRLLDILVIESIVTDLTATSDGVDATLGGTTVVTGASFMGQPVTIDADGIHAEPTEGSPLADLGGALAPAGDPNEVLAQAGIRVTLAGPVAQDGETAGQLVSTGLRIDLEISDRTFPIISQLASQVPIVPDLAPGAPTVADVLVAAQARHLTRLEVARGEVSLSAREGFDPGDFDVPSFSDLSPVTPGFAAADPGTLAPLPPVAAAPAPTPELATTPASRVPQVPLGAGIGALGVLMLLVQPALGARLAGMVNTLLAADAAGACPRGER